MPPKAKTIAKRNQITGYVVLGLGILMLLGVGFLAVSRYAPKPPAEITEKNIVTKEGRAKRVTPKMMEGGWETAFLDWRAIFQLHEGTYQILALRSFTGAPRYYSRGRYTLDGAFLVLIPDDSLGTPAQDDPDHKYLPLHTRPFTVELRLKDGTQSWFPVAADPGFPNRNPVHPLIQFSGEDALVWTRKE